MVIEKLEEIAQDVRDIKRQNRQLLAQNEAGNYNDHGSYRPLPLKTLKEVEETENIIRSRSQFQKLVNLFFEYVMILVFTFHIWLFVTGWRAAKGGRKYTK